MWIGQFPIYFLSDRNGPFTLFPVRHSQKRQVRGSRAQRRTKT